MHLLWQLESRLKLGQKPAPFAVSALRKAIARVTNNSDLADRLAAIERATAARETTVYMAEVTASDLLTEMKPAWKAALGDRASERYIAGFIRRNVSRLEAALDPIVATLNAIPEVHVAELAEDVAKRLRGRSEIVNVLANAPHNFGVELDRQLPQVMLEYLPEGTGTPQRWAVYRRWSDDAEFRRQLRAQVYELLWERRPGLASGAAEHEEKAKAETRNSVRSVRLRSAATNLAHQRVQVAADSIAKLRHQDVERVLRETPAEERRQVAYILGDLRADLSSEIDEVMREVLGEPANWSEYGRQEIYEPGSRAKREATLAEDSAERAQECSVERALEAAAPMIAETEREIAAAKGEPLPVVMVSLEAGGILLLSPLGFLGREIFQIYRDDTARLQYVSYPKKGQRGIPKVVARAVLALERDGFDVRAEDPEVVKSLIVTGGLDHALPVGPPPPRAASEGPSRPPTRTAEPDLIARVNALAADPPTSTIKYLVKTLRERGDLPLQVKDWKEGGWRPVETAIEEAEGKVARKLARKPKAERLRAGGEERPAKDANEEHAAQALVQLANMDPDKARQVNDAGFSKSDVATGHTLARRWEATGELTGDEWEWAVAVANKYRRQVGPLPEPKGKGKRQQPEARTIDMGNNESLSMGVFEDTDGTFYAMTFSQSKDGFKTRAGAERWLARHVGRPEDSGISAEERLFVGVMPTGIVYADRSREVDGDYTRCAFLPFDTLFLAIAPKCPKDMVGLIEADAATIIARRGEQFPISSSNQTVFLGSKYVPATSTATLTNTPSGRVHLSPAASRMLAKMTDGAGSLALSHKDTESLAAALELRDAGLAEFTEHHGEPRVALPMLTVDNHERASMILNVAHPEWGIKRFNRDPSERGHHSFGTGSNSAVLFASDFSDWVVASWLPTAAEVDAEHAEREAYLDENRPGWREGKRATAPSAVTTIRRNTKLGKQILTAPAEVHAYSLNNGFSGSDLEVSRFVAMMANNIANGQDFSIRTGTRPGWYTVQLHSNLWYEVRLANTPELMKGPSAPIDNRKVEAKAKRERVKQMQADVSAHNAAIVARREAGTQGGQSFNLGGSHITTTLHDMFPDERREEARMGAALRGARDVEEAEWERDVEQGTRAEMRYHGLGLEEARRAAVANLGRDAHYYEKMNEEKWGYRP